MSNLWSRMIDYHEYIQLCMIFPMVCTNLIFEVTFSCILTCQLNYNRVYL